MAVGGDPASSQQDGSMGSLNPWQRNENAHKRVEMGFNGSAGGKNVNRVQDCHPALRADYRERWYHEDSGRAPPQRMPKSYRVDISQLERNVGRGMVPINAEYLQGGAGMGNYGTSDNKMMNRAQMPHPVLRNDGSYRKYIVAGGAPRSGSGFNQRGSTVQRSRASRSQKGAFMAPIGINRTLPVPRSKTAMAAYARHRPPPVLPPPAQYVPGMRIHSPPSPPASAPVLQQQTSDEPNEGGSMTHIVRRQLQLNPSAKYSPPLPPSLSSLTPVPTLSWNGTTGHHPCMPMQRAQGVWEDEPEEDGPLRNYSPMSPGSGSPLTPGVGANPNLGSSSGRLLRPLHVADDKYKAMDLNSAPTSPPQSPLIAPRAGGGGAAELRQRTTGDRIWLSGQSWMGFS